MMYLVSKYLQEKTKLGMEGTTHFLAKYTYMMTDSIEDVDKMAALKMELNTKPTDIAKILNGIHLYHELAAIREGRRSIYFIKNLIEQLYNEMWKNKDANTTRYRDLIEDLNKKIHTILPDTQKPANDLQFGEGTTTVTLR